jgi:hypothetical protein
MTQEQNLLDPMFSRRHFCRWAAASGLAISTPLCRTLLSDELPKVTHPRATDGDSQYQPNWTEKLTVTVGTKDADFVGNDHRVIQGALEYVKRLGGGTVHVLPGTYLCRNAIVLPSGIRLLGSGLDSILTKIDSETVVLEQDSDWYDQEITLKLPNGFRVGDGIVLRAKNPHDGGPTVIKRTLIARNGQRFKLDKGLRENLWISGKPTCSSLFPILTSELTSDVTVENITIDGNKANNENFDGNYGGCIFIQDCQRYQFKKLTTRNYNGDGISFQICHDVLVEDCHSHDNTNLGVHPGSGSQRPLIRNSRLNNNSQGIFWCWGVKYGLAENNVLDGNSLYGTSIGHNDTDNVFIHNKILNSGKIGILFRNETGGQDFFPNRNRIEDNEIVNSGDENGIAIDVQGATKDVQLVRNTILETRASAKRIGIRIGSEVVNLRNEGNKFTGLDQDLVDQRSPK